MKLENQIIKLGLARQLKMLGVKQDSLWYINANGKIFNKEYPTKIEIYSAFTVAELGEMLPDNVGNCYLEITTFNDSGMRIQWQVVYKEIDKLLETLCQSTAKTEADARAKMLIKMIEEKIIEIENEN